MGRNKTVVFDFDGVINSYKSGFTRVDQIPDPPVKGIKNEIDKIRQDYFVVVVSTRCATETGRWAVKNYLEKYGIVVDAIIAEKPPAVCYIDDRAICFDGTSDGLSDKIKKFRSWCEK